MKLTKAVSLSLGDLDQPVVTSYQLGLIIYNLYFSKSYKNEQIKQIKKQAADYQDFTRIVRNLYEEGILSRCKGLPIKAAYSVLGRKPNSPDEVVCLVDPFCYLSHLSALSYHGMTNRIPAKVFISTPTNDQWKIFAFEKMSKDLKKHLHKYINSGFPKLTKIKISKINKKDIHIMNSSHLGAYRNVKDRALRVSTIGRTFLDMLRNPELCGGINHVLEIFENHAADYLDLIIDEIDQHGRPIDKVRAGYIIDEVLNLSSDRIDKWLSFVQRGGSRKLDSTQEYMPEHSAKWCISINTY